MQHIDLITRLNNLANKDEVAIYFKALRQDGLIWRGLQNINQYPSLGDSLTRQKKALNPGTLAVLISDPEFDFSTLNAKMTSREGLEKLMFGFENYIQSEEPANSLENAGLLALALIQKRKVSANWLEIFQDIVTRMKITDSSKFRRLWGTILVIVVNLLDEKEELIRDLTLLQPAEISVEILNHLVLCQPWPEEEKSETLRRYLYPLSPQIQVLALKNLKKMAGRDMSADVAGRILEKYRPVDSEKKATSEYWRNPVSSMHYAFQCQAAADIASLAGKADIAAELSDRSFEVFSALVKMSKVKKAGIVFDSHPEKPLEALFTNEELSDPEILTELAYTDGHFELPLPQESSTARVIQQAKKMTQAGNALLAREELRESLKLLSEDDLEKDLVNGPGQLQGWDPVTFLNLLIETGAFEEARRLSKIVLAQNPSNIAANKAAAAANEGMEDYSGALEHLETLAALDPNAIDIKRRMAQAYLMLGSNEAAFETYKEIIDQSDLVEENDLIRFGEIALKNEKPDEALRAAGEVLGRYPDSAKGLTLAGMAHHKKGQDEAAIEELRKAIMIADGDPQPWIELADIIWFGGDHASSLMTLKEGIAANPGNSNLQCVYARKLMEENLISEAFPYLLELSVKGSDAQVDLLLIDAMKHLGMENVDETLENFINKYPQDYRFKGEYGARLIWKGEIDAGMHYLQPITDHLPEDTAWSLAYVEGVLKPDYQSLSAEDRLDKTNLSFTRQLLEEVLIREPDNLRAKLLKAEWLLQSEDFPAARKIFDEIMDESQGGRELPSARLYTGLARAAARTGEHEIAMAALEQAISIAPDWLGLQRIKSEFYQLAGDDAAAVKQGLIALDMSKDVAESHVWLINFLSTLGKTDIIEKLTSAAIEQFPEHLGLRLLHAQSSIGNASEEEIQLIEQKLLLLIDNTEDAAELVKAAIVFAALDNPHQTIACLEKAAASNNLEAQLSLAGLYRMSGEFEKALAVIGNVEPATTLTKLLKAEIEFEQFGKSSQWEYQMGEHFEFQPPMISEKFLPAAWKEIFESSKPEIALQTRILMRSGDPAELMGSVCEWINADPKNVEARIYGIELALACGAEEDYHRFLDLEISERSGNYVNHLSLLKTEYLLDTNALMRDDPVETRLFETISITEPDKISKIRALAADGNLRDAESIFDMAMSVFSDVRNFSHITRLGLIRNLAKCAAVLDRWSEALRLSAQGVNMAPKNASLKLLHLQYQAQALEMKNRAEDLGIEKHFEKADSCCLSATQEIQQVDAAIGERDELKHWALRLKLAMEPNRENIRALALLTPAAEDAAALMVGLRRIGQEKTAIQVAKKFANHPLVLFELARCTAQNDLSKAAETIERSLVVHPFQPLALRLRSELLERAGKLAEAAESLEQAIDFWPNEFRWHEKAAELWQSLGNVDKPVEHLKMAALYSSGDSLIQEKLGKALLNTAQPVEALKHLLAVVEKQPEHQDLWQSISEAHQQSGDLSLAMEAAERAVQVAPFSVKARLQASKIRWLRGELEKALDQVNLAISLDPEDAENYVFMAKLLLEQGEKGKALQMLEKASQSKNANVGSMVEHASLLKEIKGSAAARDLIASFSEKYPENPELLRMLAEAEEQCGNLKKAELVARKALDIQPDEADLQMLLGKIQEKVGNLDQAVNYYSQAIALEPKRKEAYLNLSQVYLKQRDHAKARKALEEGINRNPDAIDLYLACASLLKEGKDYQAAEKMLRQASSLEPRNVNIHRQLGAVLALNLVHQSQEVSSQP